MRQLTCLIYQSVFLPRHWRTFATLRADNGGTMSRLRFASDNIATTKTNMEAANGRIIDVDVAAESTQPSEV